MILYLQQFPLSTDWQLLSSSMPEKCYFLKRRRLPPSQWLLRLLILLWIWWTGRYTGRWQQPGRDSREIKRLLAACDMDLKARCPKVQSPKNSVPWLCISAARPQLQSSLALLKEVRLLWEGRLKCAGENIPGLVLETPGVHYTALLATSCETWENPLNSYSVSLPL